MDKSLQALLDRHAILEAIYLYCRGLDRLDVETVRKAYHEDATDDRGPGLFQGRAFDLAVQAVNTLRERYSSSQHFIGNVLLDIEGDTAFGESYFQAYHRHVDKPGKPGMELTMGGRYLDRFEKRDGVWKIAHRKMINDWSRTQPVGEAWLEKHPGAYRPVRDISGSRL